MDGDGALPPIALRHARAVGLVVLADSPALGDRMATADSRPNAWESALGLTYTRPAFARYYAVGKYTTYWFPPLLIHRRE